MKGNPSLDHISILQAYFHLSRFNSVTSKWDFTIFFNLSVLLQHLYILFYSLVSPAVLFSHFHHLLEIVEHFGNCAYLLFLRWT